VEHAILTLTEPWAQVLDWAVILNKARMFKKYFFVIDA
jgi:hypothetical protein